jgi:hypothetical protein
VPETVKIALEVNERSRIEGRRWDDAVILGPAVLALFDGVVLSDCDIEGPEEAVFIEVPLNKPMLGVIGIENVTFHRCRFENVGIVALAETITRFTGQRPSTTGSPSPSVSVPNQRDIERFGRPSAQNITFDGGGLPGAVVAIHPGGEMWLDHVHVTGSLTEQVRNEGRLLHTDSRFD